jgi:hypothetical protein
MEKFLESNPKASMSDLYAKVESKYYRRQVLDQLMVDLGYEWVDLLRDIKKY